ncbi:MAG: ATP-binding protein [Actinobacteria bacterium]|nr:ATP-binding protein [Actinomycetota bacterium]
MRRRAINTRWRLFLSYFVIILALVIALSFAVRSIGIRAVTAHMAGMPGSSAMMAGDLEKAVRAGLNQAVLWGGLAALMAAVIASFLVSGWITRPLLHMAEVAHRIAGGDYAERVDYESDDDIGRFAGAFNNMAGQLQKTEEVRRELLGTVLHEIRTPLATIGGYMQGLMDGVIPAEPETYELVRKEASRLGRILKEVERLSRLEAGAEAIRPQRLNVAGAVEGVASALRPLLAQSELDVSVNVVDRQLEVWADPDKFAQILGNLLSNSLRYIAAGGRVGVTAQARDSAIAFTVEDNGRGIPAEDLPHIFERFYRVDKSRSQAGGGSGIGLAVVKALVQQMGGSISVESKPGKVTRFTFSLPRAPKTP